MCCGGFQPDGKSKKEHSNTDKTILHTQTEAVQVKSLSGVDPKVSEDANMPG